LAQTDLLGVFHALDLFIGNCRLKRSNRSRQLFRQKNAFDLIFSVHDFQQPLGIWLEHDEIASDFGFEFIEHA